MIRKRFYVIVFALIGWSTSSCNNNSNTQKEVTGAPIMDRMEERANEAVQDINAAVQDVKVDFNKLVSTSVIGRDVLQGIFPANIAGLTRSKIEVDDANVLNFSKIEAKYENPGDPKSINLQITDGAGDKGGKILADLWKKIQNGRAITERDEYEKAGAVLGHKAWIKESTASNDRDAEIKLLYADRYIIEIEGEGYTLQELTKILESIDFSALK